MAPIAPVARRGRIWLSSPDMVSPYNPRTRIKLQVHAHDFDLVGNSARGFHQRNGR